MGCKLELKSTNCSFEGYAYEPGIPDGCLECLHRALDGREGAVVVGEVVTPEPPGTSEDAERWHAVGIKRTGALSRAAIEISGIGDDYFENETWRKDVAFECKKDVADS